jgi:RNA polymerase sigma-70 factor (ECF subfamily)
VLAQMTELDAFLASVERRAYVMARSMTGDPDESLDVVQDAMLRFVAGYGRRPSAEWRPLFFRILINRVRDGQRRQAVRARFMSWLRPEDRDPVETAPAPPDSRPLEVLMAEETMDAIDAGLRALPPRQQEAFALRCLEGMDVAATARAMGCSEGSVKTHYSRALAALRRRLGADDDRP